MLGTIVAGNHAHGEIFDSLNAIDEVGVVVGTPAVAAGRAISALTGCASTAKFPDTPDGT